MTDKKMDSSADFRQREIPIAERKVVLRIRNVRKTFGGQVVLDGVSADLREGEVVLLQGDNGSGKTTLLNILTGNLEPDDGAIHLHLNGATEDFRFPRRWWQDLNPFDHFTPERVAVEGVGRTWQDVRLFNTLTLADNITVATAEHPGENPFNALIHPRQVNQAESAANARSAAVLDTLGLNGRSQSSADMISLGQTKRVGIARAASAGGKVLFLDEPLAGLDIAGIQTVLQFLRDLVSEHRLTLVIVEHVWNAQHILAFATTLWTLRNGTLTAEALVSQPKVEEIASLKATPVCLQTFFAGLRCVGTQVLPRDALLSVYRLPDRASTGDVLLEVKDLMVRRGLRSVIGDNERPCAPQAGLSFRLHDGDLAILQAPNGWGKTTLLDALAGLLPSTHGRVCVLGKDITKDASWERSRAGLHLLRANGRTFPSLTVNEAYEVSGGGTLPASFEHLRNQNMRRLSGGEQQAVSLGQVYASSKCVYLLDEPFSALDANHVADTFKAVHELTRRERTAVLIAVPSGGVV